MKKPKIQVNLRTFLKKWPIDRVGIRAYLRRVWNAFESHPEVKIPQQTEVSVVLMNNTQIQKYNRTYRKMDSPTDVLSFLVNETTPENTHYLGDILISIEKAKQQGKEKGHTLDEELEILLLHGVLHLLGYDHEQDSGEMSDLERELHNTLRSRKRLILPHPTRV